MNDKLIGYLSQILKTAVPLCQGLFDTIELLNFEVSNKIVGQGLSVIHCKPTLHYILVENMNNNFQIRLWDGIGFDNNNTKTQTAKMFATGGSTIMECVYVKNPKQVNGFECGDLCIAKAIELLTDKDPSEIEFATPERIRCDTASLLVRREMIPYPKAVNKRHQYTIEKIIKFRLLRCCLLPKSYAPTIACICNDEFHAKCVGIDSNDNTNGFLCSKCIGN